jgi:hypothetical protein
VGDDIEQKIFEITKRLFLLEQKQDFQRLSIEVQYINLIFLSWINQLELDEEENKKKQELYDQHFGFFELANEYNEIIDNYEDEVDMEKCKELEIEIIDKKESLFTHYRRFFETFEYFQIKMIDHVGRK